MIKITFIRTYLHHVSNSSISAILTQFSKLVNGYVVPVVDPSKVHQNLQEN